MSMGREPSSSVGDVDEVIGYGAALRMYMEAYGIVPVADSPEAVEPIIFMNQPSTASFFNLLSYKSLELCS